MGHTSVEHATLAPNSEGSVLAKEFTALGADAATRPPKENKTHTTNRDIEAGTLELSYPRAAGRYGRPNV